MSDTTTSTTTDELPELLAALRERYLKDENDEDAVVCRVDGYPSPLTCVCGHGHTRHTGTDEIRCMSYVGNPDCGCLRFSPDPASVSAMWLAFSQILTEFDVEKITHLVPDVRASLYVRDWPADEQAEWDAHLDDHDAALVAVDVYRRRKAATAILRALVGKS
jgi:hypothetical protein